MVKKNDQAYDWSNNTEIEGHVKTNGVGVVEVSCKVFQYWGHYFQHNGNGSIHSPTATAKIADVECGGWWWCKVIFMSNSTLELS